ncbi:hypothetical protein A3D06_02190 [Candidatus Roizmanbacteria bacterium RIFCSPHIGHO2_02_FULL_40_9]|uniref:MIP18 family-like domain-containing protein n=2 Tax=Candidatus Roizmaniibacteriota TaxID=1752723 RepID=A0A1F7IMF8_9BACT|nr:MAG: hypothetical protein A3D06_02190 [Candidatus Roizmanbacteria bacterium RIFCSPHIGHO2_02_FULL_40_9]OGK44554.1 MAG: hypothetical protein A2957_00645 [Candidatus Roizmanbacteria bacterium RIFCSPLOWO2_01_FULL_38_11]
MTQSVLVEKIKNKLYEVNDPELHISIVDLGLIYEIQVKKQKAYITMTLTTIGCPLFSTIEMMMREKILELDEIENVYLELVFDPPWSMERMTERGKAILGI